MDTRRLLHELQVHQVELAQQNEDLIAARNEVGISLRRYVALYESAPVGLVTVDRHGVVLDINRRARVLLAGGATGLVGCALLPSVAEGSRSALWQAIRQPLPDGGWHGLDITLPSAPDHHGRVLHADLQADPTGEHCVLIALTDITERLALEEARRAEHARAEAASRAKSDFLARMSHDLRTPLNAVMGFAYLLQRDSVVMAAPGGAMRVNQIHRAGRHLLSMIDDLLDVARIETGDLQLLIEPVNLQLVAADCVVLTEALASQHRVQVTVTGDWQGRWASADRRRLHQALLNLVTNAVKYNRPGGSVAIRLVPGRDDHRVTLCVQDTGLGMTAEQIAGMYQPFNRLGAERGQVEGTGLGLVIARQLVVAMGGELAVSSSPGTGSVFSVTLPSAAEGLPAADPAHDPVAASTGPKRPMTVLYVEDNPVNLELMQALLDSRPLVHLAVAEDGRAGLDAARRLRPDLVLLDMHLPLMSGLQVLQHLRADPATAQLVCVAVSANGMPEDITLARDAGFDDYVVKPFDPDRLLGLIDAIGA
jgi:PAS domain S-box-containing protein